MPRRIELTRSPRKSPQRAARIVNQSAVRQDPLAVEGAPSVSHRGVPRGSRRSERGLARMKPRKGWSASLDRRVSCLMHQSRTVLDGSREKAELAFPQGCGRGANHPYPMGRYARRRPGQQIVESWVLRRSRTVRGQEQRSPLGWAGSPALIVRASSASVSNFRSRVGRAAEAAEAFATLSLTTNEAERAFLGRRRDAATSTVSG